LSSVRHHKNIYLLSLSKHKIEMPFRIGQSLFKMKHIITIFIIILTCKASYGQADRLTLNQRIFDNQVNNKLWTVDDSTKQDPNEMFVVGFVNDTISLGYIDWIKGLNGVYGKYSGTFKNNIVEIKPEKLNSSIGLDEKTKRPKPVYILLLPKK